MIKTYQELTKELERLLKFPDRNKDKISETIKEYYNFYPSYPISEAMKIVGVELFGIEPL